MIQTLEDWAIVDFQGYMILTGHVPQLEARINTTIVDGASREADPDDPTQRLKLLVACESGERYWLGHISPDFCARYPTAYARIERLVGLKEKAT